MKAISDIAPEKLVFVDEASSNLGMTPTYARSPQGQRAFAKRPGNRGSNISMVGAIRLSGIPVLHPYDGAVDGSRFLSFLDDHLIPTLKPGDVVVMDNVRTHHIREVAEKIEAQKAKVLYLPPYHPELNPIEEAWSKIKNSLKKAEARTIPAYVKALESAKSAVSQENISGWFRHAGYALND